MIKYLAEFLVWFVETTRKRYKEDLICSFMIDAWTVLTLLGLLLMGVGRCMNTALHRDTAPGIEQAVPAEDNGQAVPLPKQP